jgi:hypothetical protein
VLASFFFTADDHLIDAACNRGGLAGVARPERKATMTARGARVLWAVVTATALIGFAALLVGCASLGPVRPVAVSNLGSVAGTWKGVVYGPGSEPEYVELTIGEDGSYDVVSRQEIGESRGNGKVVLRDGRLLLEGPKGHGVGIVVTNAAGDRVMNIEATLSDNSTLSAELSRSR